MKFSSIICAVLGLTTFAAALPAPSPVEGLNLKADLIERDALPALQERTVAVNLVADVQVCIDAVVSINKKYAHKKSSSKVIKQWAIEVTAQIEVLISVISAYPSGCTYPSIDVCVNIFVKLFVCIFVQLKVFLDAAGLIVSLLLSVDLLLSILLGLVGDLLNICISLLVLLEVKIKVGICGLILNACVGLIATIYLQVIVKLCIKAGLVVVLKL